MSKLDNILQNFQLWLLSKGADREYCIWDKLGNAVQDIRTFISLR